jgi:hypothetical protein
MYFSAQNVSCNSGHASYVYLGPPAIRIWDVIGKGAV